jgi:hypothetical protein
MENLTARQIELVSGVNRHLKDMGFGEIVDKLIDSANAQHPIQTGTPVNAVNASEILTLTDVVTHGETVIVNNPKTLGVDIYEFLTDADQVLVNGNIAVDIEADTVKSSISLKVSVHPKSGDTITIGVGDGEKEYTFVPEGTANADGEISIGENVGEAQENIVAAINGTDDHNTPHTQVTAGDFAEGISIITAIIGGTIGDDIATTSNFTDIPNEFTGATLDDGVDCSAADAIAALLLAVDDGDTQGVTAADGEGTTVVFTAAVAGEEGNLIEVDSTMDNGSFGETELSGGVDGTIGTKHDILADASFIYMCIANNSVSGKNWRRISLGNAY